MKKFILRNLFGAITFIILVWIICFILSYKFGEVKSGILCGLCGYVWAVLSMAIHTVVFKKE